MSTIYGKKKKIREGIKLGGGGWEGKIGRGITARAKRKRSG